MHILSSHNTIRVVAVLLFCCLGVCPQPISGSQNPVQPGEKLLPPQLSEAIKGDVTAELQTGEWYNSGVSGTVDSAQAAMWFQRASDHGSADATALLGSLYLYGHGVAVDQAKAYSLIQSAAARGSLKAKTFLAQMYMHGWQVEKNHAKADALLQSVGEKDPFAMTLQGIMQVEDTSTIQSGKKLLESAAGQGESGAMLTLGEIYLFGVSSPQDFEKAATWFKRAVRLDNRAAEFRLGQMYAKGAGVPKNLTQAYSLFHRSAEQEYIPAQTLCGTYNYYGFGIPKNPAEAYYWFSKAAAHSNGAKAWLKRIAKQNPDVFTSAQSQP